VMDRRSFVRCAPQPRHLPSPVRSPNGAALAATVRPDELERKIQARLNALPPAARAELLHVLMLPDFDRADQIGAYWANPKTRTFAELLIDCEEDRTLRAVLVGMLREDR
jgi:hypothetical protein